MYLCFFNNPLTTFYKTKYIIYEIFLLNLPFMAFITCLFAK